MRDTLDHWKGALDEATPVYGPQDSLLAPEEPGGFESHCDGHVSALFRVWPRVVAENGRVYASGIGVSAMRADTSGGRWTPSAAEYLACPGCLTPKTGRPGAGDPGQQDSASVHVLSYEGGTVAELPMCWR